MIDSLFHAMEIAVQGPHLTGMRWRPSRSGHQSRLTAPIGAYQGPQGWIVLQVMQGQWAGMCRAMGQPELEADERFATIRDRQVNRVELNAMIEAWMAALPDDAAVLAALEAERVPCAPVMEPAAAVGNEYFESRRMIRHVTDPILGEVHIPGNPLRFSDQPQELDLVAPLLGEHNDAVLAELGYDAARIAELHAAGVLRRGDR